MMSKPILYDLGISLGAVTLWFTPFNITRAIGYSLSLVFSGRAYYSGIVLLANERRLDEKQAITYEAETDFYDQLLGTNIDAALEVKALEVENRMIERMIPLMAQKTELEKQLHRVHPTHPEMTEQDREQVARAAIDDAFTTAKSSHDHNLQITEEDIKKHFPEQMDSTSWKAILKALQNGLDKAEIVKDILGCNDSTKLIGIAYLEYLKQKFL
jgi:dsDNA-binding SOS-regulon protein